MSHIQNEFDLIRLVYVSKVTEEFSTQNLNKIICVSQKNNHLLNITGILIYGSGRFMQFLEGPQFNVMKIFSVIKKDFRHHSIDVLRRKKIVKRQFDNWDMRLTYPNEIQMRSGPIYKKLFEAEEKKPEIMDFAIESRALLLAFKKAC